MSYGTLSLTSAHMRSGSLPWMGSWVLDWQTVVDWQCPLLWFTLRAFIVLIFQWFCTGSSPTHAEIHSDVWNVVFHLLLQQLQRLENSETIERFWTSRSDDWLYIFCVCGFVWILLLRFGCICENDWKWFPHNAAHNLRDFFWLSNDTTVFYVD